MMKPEVVFGLEGAAWPALLVDAGGLVLLSNTAAQQLLGIPPDCDSVQLDSFWATENNRTAADFLTLWESSPVSFTDLKFWVADGTTQSYSTAIALLANEASKWFVLQLLPPVEKPAAAPQPSPVAEIKPTPTGDVALKQKLECVLQLARTVSLDFNNALTGVLAHTSLLLGKAPPEHPWRRSLLEVEKSAARAAEIAGELAVFSRQEKEARRAPPCNLNTVVGRCVDFFRSAHGARFDWRMTQERSLFEARLDEAKVQQALTKVLENAVESFAANASGTISVETRNMELTQPTQDRNVRLAAGDYVCVEVSDAGAGIEAESLPRIFEPFFTTKKPPHRGLGLAMIYGIITNHGGGVAISSQAGKGTSVRVYLPAEKTFVREASGTDLGLRGSGTVLMVDDEELLLTMAETILSEFGYQVLTASSGQKALAILAQPETKVDLVVTDLVMPGMGGRELIERIRQIDPTLPVMCTSGYVMPEDKKTGGGYLQKPFTSTDLLLKVKAALPAAV